MPNHMHGILIIDKSPTAPANPIKGGFAGVKNPMVNENVSRIIRWYKGRTTFDTRKINPDFAWQTRFHDHIIRNAKSYETIRTYIIHNPANWPADRYGRK
jgi:putative transposase